MKNSAIKITKMVLEGSKRQGEIITEVLNLHDSENAETMLNAIVPVGGICLLKQDLTTKCVLLSKEII